MSTYEELPQQDSYLEATKICKEFEHLFQDGCPLTKVINLFREERTHLIQILSNNPSKIVEIVPALKKDFDEALDQSPEARTVMQRESIRYGIIEMTRCLVKSRLGI